VDRRHSPWRWTRTHSNSGALEGWVCADCPHTRVLGVARQPYRDANILGGGLRSPGPPGAVQGGSCPAVCRIHPFGCPLVLPMRLVRVRGDPPSAWISRPYLRSPGSDPASSRGLNGVSLYSPRLDESRDALTYLLSNVETVFESYERCLDE